MGERQWGRRAADREPGVDPRIVSLPLRQVPPPEEAPSSRHGRRDTFDRGGYPIAIGELVAEFTEAAEDGVALDHRGQPYTVEALRAHRRALSYVDAELGVMAVQDVRRRNVQELVDQLMTSGLAPARVLAVVDSLSALYSYAIRRDLVDFSPVVELQLPDAESAPSPFARDTPPPFATGDLPRTSNPAMPTNGTWPPHPFMAPGGSWPPLGFMTPGDPRTPPPFMTPGGTWPPPAGPGYLPGPMGHTQLNGTGPGSMSAMFGSPGATGPDANYDATMQERWLWWTVRIIVIVFVLIALVLVAESV
jgi:hypothetical protein